MENNKLEILKAEIEQFKAEAMKMHFVQTWAATYKTDPFEHMVDDVRGVFWLKAQAYQLWQFWNAAKAAPEGFVLVDKKHTEDWYLDDQEGMWWGVDGIDNSLCDLDPGQVQAIDHKEYLITESNTVYAAKVWDESNDQVGFWEFFKTKDEAEKTAAYCKAKFKGGQIEAQEQSHDNSN